MNISLIFIRLLFAIFSLFFFTAAMTGLNSDGFTVANASIGLSIGIVFFLFLMTAESYFRRTNLRALNTTTLGLFFGSLLGLSMVSVFSGMTTMGGFFLPQEMMNVVNVAIYLFATYTGLFLTSKAAEEIHISLPFIRFQPTTQKKKDILLDTSILQDSRIIDLASSGLVDNLLVLPRFALKELQEQVEGPNEVNKSKARRSLEVIKKLESMQNLGIRYNDTDFPEIKDTTAKTVRLARLHDSSILTADINRIEQSSIEGINVININSLSNALKPLTQTGEHITIKVQRYGKEARQGVGYLDDGTMVVINGGAEYIGETIKAQVLSVKHTSSGRMIFCNANDDCMMCDQEYEQPQETGMDGTPKNYFAL